MKRRTFLIWCGVGTATSSCLSLLPTSGSAQAQTQPGRPQPQQRPVNAREFGPLVSGTTNDPAAIAANTATLQTAINLVGQQGGGTIVIPEGHFQIAPPDLKKPKAASLVIAYDNITLVGAGIGKTVLHSRGDWSFVPERKSKQRPKGSVVRGHGIFITGTSDPNHPRRNIFLKNFELFGGTNGHTGDRAFPAKLKNGDGWDLTHKGIVLDFGKYIDNVTIDAVFVHDFRGELIYGGGGRIGKLRIINSALANSNASLLSLDADLEVKNCKFGRTANAWVENAPVTSGRSYLIYDCIFQDSDHLGLVLAQGTLPTGHRQVIRNNQFSNCRGGICILGGVGGTRIQNNQFYDCGDALLVSAMSGRNHDIEFINNEVYGRQRAIALARLAGPLEDVQIRGNKYQASQTARSQPVIFYQGNLRNIVVEANIFKGGKPPKQIAEIKGETPIFQNNRFI